MNAPATRELSSIEISRTALIDVVQAIDPADQLAVFEIRRRVFAEEQGAPNLLVSDSDDARSLIALARIRTPHENGSGWRPAATGRLTPYPLTGVPALVAWVATLPDVRGRGIGRELMRFLLAAADADGVPEVILAAQAPAEWFYRRLGFEPTGPLYDVRGIPHRRMSRRRPH